MADPNTCEQCGISNHNKPNITIRQSGKGKLVCQPCYDIINPPEEAKWGNWEEKYTGTPLLVKKGDEIKVEKVEPSIPSSKTQEEKGTFRSSIRRFPR